MRVYPKTIKESPRLTNQKETWIRGLNQLVSSTQIRPDELSSAIDIQLVEDGKVQCPRDGQTYYGSSNGSRNYGIFPYYKSDGTKELLRMSATTLQLYSGGSWGNVSGFSYTSAQPAEGALAYDRLYLVNGVDHLTYYDGSSITSFTQISAPSAPTVTPTGTTGSFTFSYKITAVTAVGETTPSPAGTATLNQGTLDASNYMTVSWSAVTNAIGYNVYGNTDGSWYFMNYVQGNASNSYKDDGTDTPYEAGILPEQNSTAGPIGIDIEVYKDSLFVAGDPANPSRLFYSGSTGHINDFSTENNGGLIDISKNDGQKIVALKLYKDVLLIFKENSIYQFSFSTSNGAPMLSQITAAVGACSTRSVLTVENDVFFAHQRGVFTIGNEAGFAFDVLRTNELSSRVRSVWQTIDPAYIQNISGVYATKSNVNLIIFAYTPAGSTTNSAALVYDRERLGWYQWTNIQANCWTSFIDSTGTNHVLYGDDASGYVKEILNGSDDFGSAIQGSFAIKSESFKDITLYKKIKDLTVVLRKPTGNVNMSLIVDGTTTAFSANISTVSPSINFGHYLMSRFLLDVSYGTGTLTAASELVERTKRNLNILGRTFGISFNNGSSGASFTLLNVTLTAKPRSARFRQSEDIIN